MKIICNVKMYTRLLHEKSYVFADIFLEKNVNFTPMRHIWVFRDSGGLPALP